MDYIHTLCFEIEAIVLGTSGRTWLFLYVEVPLLWVINESRVF